jgi:predicted secreted protein
MIRNDSGQIDFFKMVMGVFMSLITVGIIGVAQNILTFQVSIAEINKDILNLSMILENMGEESLRRDSTRYTGSQAVADWRLQASVDSIQDSALQRFSERADLLEERITHQE